MDEAYDACFVDEGLGGHTAEFEDLNLLAVFLEHAVFGVGKAGEGEIVLAEVVGEFFGVFVIMVGWPSITTLLSFVRARNLGIYPREALEALDGSKVQRRELVGVFSNNVGLVALFAAASRHVVAY